MKEKILKRIVAIFAIMSMVLSVAIPVFATDDKINERAAEFDLRGKTFSGTYSERSCSLKFYSAQYNETQDTCLELKDGWNVSYIYFNYRLWDSDINTLEVYTGAVTGYLSDFAPLSIKCEWKNKKLTFKISATNGMTVCYGDFELTNSEANPGTGDEDTSNYEFSLSGDNYYIEGEKGTLNLSYQSAAKGEVLNELKEITWENSNPDVATISGLDNGIADVEKNKVSAIATVDAKKVGTTTITGTSPDNRTASINIVVFGNDQPGDYLTTFPQNGYNASMRWGDNFMITFDKLLDEESPTGDGTISFYDAKTDEELLRINSDENRGENNSYFYTDYKNTLRIIISSQNALPNDKEIYVTLSEKIVKFDDGTYNKAYKSKEFWRFHTFPVDTPSVSNLSASKKITDDKYNVFF